MSEKNENDYAYSDAEGIYLVKLARRSLTEYLKSNKKIAIPNDAPEILKKNSGIFVTLQTFSKKGDLDLRGCIGRPFPEDPLVVATIDSAIDAGTEDYRFGRVQLKELDNIIFEITALTPPEKIEAKDVQGRLDAIKIGRDGLLIRRKGSLPGHGGLFLPQVPIEWHWNKEEYLTELCGKARISPDMWKKVDQTELLKFRGEIFQEETPNGNIKRVIL
jgi:uncharacterized protein (TIGR00296 family)